MRWAIGVAILLAGVLAASCGEGETPAITPTIAPSLTATPSSTSSPVGRKAEVTVLVEDAQFPVDLEFAPDGRLFYNELRTGRVRIVGQAQPLAELEVVKLSGYSEHGLLGLAI